MDSFVSDWLDAIVSRVQMEVLRPIRIVIGAVKCIYSGDFIYYPMKGVTIFFQDWQNTFPIYFTLFYPSMILETFFRTFFFTFLFPANLVFLIATQGPLGLTYAWQTSQSEAESLAKQVTNVILPSAQIKKGRSNALFDHILCYTGNEDVVIPGKLQRVLSNSPVSKLLDISVWISTFLSIIYWNTLKLIPIIGYLAFNYYGLLTDMHHRMSRIYRLKRLTPRQATYYYLKEREGHLFILGISMYILESIPILGQFFFRFTNQIGIAYMCGIRLQGRDTRNILKQEAADLNSTKPEIKQIE